MSKTIGDVYLVHKQRESEDEELISEVKTILDSRGLAYKRENLPGQLESHPFNFVVPSNGLSGIAVNVIGGRNTHTLAQVWAYKCDDIKKGDWYRGAHSVLALVYDVRHQKWSPTSRAILNTRADIVIPSDSLEDLQASLDSRRSMH